MTASPAPSTPVRVGARTVTQVFRPYQRQFALGVVWLLCTNALALWIPRLLNEGVEGLRAGHGWTVMAVHGSWMAGTAALLAITRVLSRRCMFNVGRDVEYDMRRDFYAVLSLQPPVFFEKHPVGDLMSRATNDLSNVRMMFGFALLNVINTAAIYLGNIPLLLGLDARLAVAALAPYPLVFLAARRVAARVFALTKQNQEDLSALSTRVQEHLGGLQVVRAFAQEDAEQTRFDKASAAYYASSVKLAVARNLFGPVMGLLGTASALVAIWYGSVRVLDGALTVGGLVEFNGRLAALAWPTLALGWLMAVWQRGKASFDRINEVLAAAPSITSPAAVVTPEHALGSVAFTQVGVQRGDRWTLKDLNLTLPERGFVGIMGTTGSGKTTLAMLVPRLLDATVGTVAVDGVPVAQQDLSALRSNVAVAPQEAFLFSMSVLDNIRFGRPDASRDEVEALVDALALRPDVLSFPQGLDTLVGERGITLSGGQRQRVALARALLTNPKVLILDDTVSAVDAETEEHILDTLRGQEHQRTLLVTSHRLSAVKNADEILVLDAGAVVERGTHTGLLRANGRYASLWGRERVLAELERLDRAAVVSP